MAPAQSVWARMFALFIALACFFTPATPVKDKDFKTCSQSGFCKRNRAYADTATSHGSAWTSPYALDESSIAFDNGALTGTVLKTINATSGETVRLPLTIAFLESGTARVTLDEERRQNKDIELRHESKARKERTDEVQKWTIVGGLARSEGAAISKDAPEGVTRVLYGKGGKNEALVRHAPFSVAFKRDGEAHVVFNQLGFMNMEHWRPKIDKPVPEKKEGEEETPAPPPPEPEEDESTWWDETFGGNTDTKPKGPESVAMDITFPGYEHVYGVPEHTGPLSLAETRGGDGNWEEPYRLYNSDVFEYIMDSPMTLYGSIPFMQAHKKNSTVGVFWLNAAETWIDITKTRANTNPLSMGTKRVDTHSHWFSEAGLLDVFVMLGPTPSDMSKTYGELTGYTQLPQLFAIAYHQCRWNYITDDDVRDVDRKFDRYNIPYDVIWLDIEYLDGKKYFTWDPLTFPNPLGMQEQLDEHERKLVVIIDPHIKKEDGYPVLSELTQKDLAVKNNKMDGPWEGWCWPGASYWVDMFNPAAITWWKTLFRYDKFAGTAKNMFIWNDMNEPSVFNGPETTMPKDNIHHGGWEHRDIHNVNGLTFVNATFQAMAVRDDPKGKTPTTRPFILTRSFYAGSQRLGAMWTGDNQAQWPHLKASLPMILQNGVSGFPFAGADVGGFFGNPSKELLVRWYQAGAFYPFFRAHAHIDTRRREPYLAGSPYREIITQALRLRYSLLPAWYTAFHEASVDGFPVVRPMWWTHPDDDAGFALDDQMYLGSTGLLVKPVTEEGAESVSVYLPASGNKTPVPYYDYYDYTVYPSGTTAGTTHTIAAPLDRLPLLMRAGHIVPRRDRPRRSAGLMKWDPFTLIVVLDPAHPAASGSLYLDDGESYAYESGARIHRHLAFADGTLSSEDADLSTADVSKPFAKAKDAYLAATDSIVVEKIVVVGAPKAWKGKESVSVSEEAGAQSHEGTREAQMTWHAGGKGKADWAVVRRPGVKVGRGWKIAF